MSFPGRQISLDANYFDDDAPERSLPYVGGDIPNSETGNNLDYFAEMNEHSFFDQSGCDGTMETFQDNEPLLQEFVSHGGQSYQQPDVSQLLGSYTSSVPAPVLSTHDTVHFNSHGIPYGSGQLPPLACPDMMPIVGGTVPTPLGYYSQLTASPEHAVQACQSFSVNHLHACQAQEGSLQSIVLQPSVDIQLPYDEKFLIPEAPNMERKDSSGTLASVDWVLSQILPASSGIRKEIVCSQCQKTFTGTSCRRNLLRHMQCIHDLGGPKIYMCIEPDCGRTYKRGDGLRVHQTKAHPDKYPPAIPRPKVGHAEG